MTNNPYHRDGPDTSKSDQRVYRTIHSFEGQHSLSMTVLKSIDESDDIDELPSSVLADVVDPDALDSLFSPLGHRSDRMNGQIQFPFGDVQVTVHATGEVELRPIRE